MKNLTNTTILGPKNLADAIISTSEALLQIFTTLALRIKGDSYVGDWEDGKFHGYGKYKSANGDRYEGQFKYDEFDGYGTYTFADGGSYEGDWKDGKMHGKGTVQYADGNYFKGEWKDGKMHGKGTMQYADGNYFKGEWKDDEIIVESKKVKKENGTTTLLLRSTKISSENRPLKYETDKFLDGDEKVEVAVCEGKKQALAKINEFIKNNQNKDKCRIVFDQHGFESGGNDMDIDQDCAKEILKSLSKNFRDIIISDLACHGGTAKHFLKVAQGVANKHNNLESITVRYAPQGRFCVAGFKSNNEDSRFSIVTIGKDGSTELRKLMKFKPKNKLKPSQEKALTNILEGLLHH
jgi:hypothetical protein